MTEKTAQEPVDYTVTDLSRQIKGVLEGSFGRVRVRGEIGECKLHSSGHLYLSLKDESSVLAAVCWRGQVGKLGLRPAAGMDVVCIGKITAYAGQSKYQLNVESLSLAGAGAWLQMLEERRKKLAAEGLFDQERKRPLPFLPRVVGVVTSPTGAVIRDILHRLDERFPRSVLLWPVPVQGDGAADQIAAAVRGFNALAPDGATPRPDVLIIARGGGSLEDLMPFNEEVVVRAVADSAIPVITAVGHETDTTLVDYAADLRAPTPTAAAEKAVPVRADLLDAVAQADVRLNASMRRLLHDRRELVRLLARALGDPMRMMAPLMQRLDERAERLDIAWDGLLRRMTSRVVEVGGRLRHPRDVVLLAARGVEALWQRAQARMRETMLQTQTRWERVGASLAALSPQAVLERGYSLVYDDRGRILSSAKGARPDNRLRIELCDGSFYARVEGGE